MLGPTGLFMADREIKIDVWKYLGCIIMGLGAVCGSLL